MSGAPSWFRGHIGGMLPLADVALAAVFAVLMALELADHVGRFEARAPAVVPALIVAVMVGTVALRRAYPFAAYLTNGLALSLYVWIGYPGDVYPWSNAVVLYSLASHGTRWQTLVGLVTAAAGVGWYFTVTPLRTGLVDVVLVAGAWLIAWVAGTAAADRRNDLAAREQARERDAAAVLTAERERMARELHDIVGHALNVMVMHAGAARRLVRRDPDAVAEALQTVLSAGRNALDELDYLVGLLRDTDAAPRAPAVGIDGVAALCQRVAGADLDVALHVDGEARDVPATVGLAVYRIVQEALTNVVKHAHASRVDVRLQVAGQHIDVEVADNGGGAAHGARLGRGLSGLAERVEALGGTFTTAQRPEGGHSVHCVLPLGPAT